MAAERVTWVPKTLGQYIDEKKLAKFLEDKATEQGLKLGESDFNLEVCTCAVCLPIENS
jgi:hypothetical protein